MKRLFYIFITMVFCFIYSFILHDFLIDRDIFYLESSYARALAASALLATVLRLNHHSRLLSAVCILIAAWPGITQTARHIYFPQHQKYFSQYKLTELSKSSPTLPNTWVLNGLEDTTMPPSLTLPLNLSTQSKTTSIKIRLPQLVQEAFTTQLFRPLNATLKRSFKLTLSAEHLRTSEYFTFFTYGRLTIQIVNNGFLITIPNPNGTDVKAFFINDLSSIGSINSWLIQIRSNRFEIYINNLLIY